MATLTAYRGLQVVTPDPAGDGGLAIQNDLKSLVDWSPKSVWAQSADPGVNDDQTQNYYPGSIWLRTDTSPPKIFVCRSASTGAAVWQQVPVLDSTGLGVGGAAAFQVTARRNGTTEASIGAKNDGTGPSTLYLQSSTSNCYFKQAGSTMEIASNTQQRWYCNGYEFLRAKTTGEVEIPAVPLKHRQTYNDITAASDGGTVTFDLASSDMHLVTLGGNRTLALSNAKVGQRFLVTLKQDGTGSRTVTWWSGIA